MSRIFAITTIYGDGLDLLPHWLQHYTRLGVDEILLLVGAPAEQDFLAGEATKTQLNILPEAIGISREFPARVFPFVFDEYHTRYTAPLRANAKQHARVSPDDWCLHADLDEFYEFPVHLRDLIAVMEKANDWALHGHILDRVAADGSLASVTPEPSIGEQYPVGCRLTRNVFRANTRKIMLCRGRVRVNAPHDNTSNAHFSRCPVGEQSQYIAHHFRWTGTLIPKLSRRAAGAGIGPPYRAEIGRFFAYWRQHKRLDLDDPRIEPQRCGPLKYPEKEGT